MKKITIHANTPTLHLSELYHFRYVLWMLTVRDIKLRYKQTALGALWVVLQPLLTAGLFALIFGKGLRVPHEGDSYLVFAFSGLIPWLIFSGSLQRASPSLINDDRLITKVYFPRIFIPLAATLGVGIDYLIALGLGILLAAGSLESHLLLLPIATLHLFLFCSGVNLLAAALNVYFRDLKHIIPFGIQLTMFATPLVYPLSAVPSSYLWLYNLNPLVGIVELFRFALLGTPLVVESVLTSALLSLGLSTFALLLFQKMERHFADVI